MFVKPYKSKPTTSLKNSDKKKLRTRLSTQTEKSGAILIDSEVGLSQAKSAQFSSTKIHTVTNEQITCYFEESDPVLLENRGGTLIPTVYLIWKCPNLLPSNKVLTIWPPVLTKLQKGADLMAPGVVFTGGLESKQDSLNNLNKNDIVGLRVLNEKGGTAIVAICEVLMSNKEILESELSQGRFARVISILGDCLWEAGSKKLPTEEDQERCDSVHKLENSKILEENEEEAENENNNNENEENVENDDRNEETHTKIMDDLLLHGLLHTLKTTFRAKSPPELPILNSQFYSKFIQPNIPKLENTPFEIKKTSFKKLPNFLDFYQEAGLLKLSKNPENGHVFIDSVDVKHKLVRQFQVLGENNSDDQPKVEEEFENMTLPIEPGEAKSAPTVSVLYGVTSDCVKFLPGAKKGDILNGKEVRDFLTEYLKINDLLLSGGDCQPDPGLAHICKIENPVTQIKNINEAFFKKMTLHHLMTYSNRQKLFRGKTLPTILVRVVRRAGNKKVTYLGGLENYFINSDSVAQCLKKKLQASTVINELTSEEASSMFGCSVGGKKGEIFKSIQVQGGQTSIICKFLLEEFKIPSKFITIDDKTAKKKK